MEMRRMAEYGLVDVVEAASFLNLSRSKLYEMLNRQELPSVWLGKCRRIPRLALIQFVEQKLSSPN